MSENPTRQFQGSSAHRMVRLARSANGENGVEVVSGPYINISWVAPNGDRKATDGWTEVSKPEEVASYPWSNDSVEGELLWFTENYVYRAEKGDGWTASPRSPGVFKEDEL